MPENTIYQITGNVDRDIRQSYTGWIYSEEMYNATKFFGYSFEVIRGYEFEKGNIFKDYVKKMYELRLEYAKGTPMNLIAKLLMNSLYGKFGMKQERTITEVFNLGNDSERELFQTMLDNYGPSIKDFIEFDNYVITVRSSILNYTNESIQDDIDIDNTYHGLEVNVALASAITVSARMWMSVVRLLDIRIFYSDTDSYVLDTKLPDFMVRLLIKQ